MAYEPKDGDISLFPPQFKETNGKRPDDSKLPWYSGTAYYNGEKLQVALWWKAREGNDPFLSGGIKKWVPFNKEAQPGFVAPIPTAFQGSATAPMATEANNDDLPF